MAFSQCEERGRESTMKELSCSFFLMGGGIIGTMTDIAKKVLIFDSSNNFLEWVILLVTYYVILLTAATHS
jgi:hypothetical protein